MCVHSAYCLHGNVLGMQMMLEYQSSHQLNFYTALGGWRDKQVMRALLVQEKGICCNM